MAAVANETITQYLAIQQQHLNALVSPIASLKRTQSQLHQTLKQKYDYSRCIFNIFNRDVESFEKCPSPEEALVRIKRFLSIPESIGKFQATAMPTRISLLRAQIFAANVRYDPGFPDRINTNRQQFQSALVHHLMHMNAIAETCLELCPQKKQFVETVFNTAMESLLHLGSLRYISSKLMNEMSLILKSKDVSGLGSLGINYLMEKSPEKKEVYKQACLHQIRNFNWKAAETAFPEWEKEVLRTTHKVLKETNEFLKKKTIEVSEKILTEHRIPNKDAILQDLKDELYKKKKSRPPKPARMQAAAAQAEPASAIVAELGSPSPVVKVEKVNPYQYAWDALGHFMEARRLVSGPIYPVPDYFLR